MNRKSKINLKKALGYTLALILVSVAFISANIGGNAPFKANAWGPGLPFGGTGYNFTDAGRTYAKQTSMVYANDYTTYGSLQNNATRLLNQSDGSTNNHWELKDGDKNNGFWSITARLDDHIYTALRDNRAKLVVTTTAQGKTENIAENAYIGISSYIAVGNIVAGTDGLAHDSFTQNSYVQGNDSSWKGKNGSGNLSSTATYQQTGNNGRYIRVGICARLESNGGCVLFVCNYSLAQLNNVSISLSVEKVSADSSAPTVSGTSNAWTTTGSVTITDNESGVWKYIINGSATVIREDGGKTTSLNVDLSQGENKITAFNNHAIASAEKTIKYYNPTVSVRPETPQSAIPGGTVTLDGSSTVLSKNGRTVGGSYAMVATENTGYYFHSWQKQVGAGVGRTYTKSKTYTLVEGDAYEESLEFIAHFYEITTGDTTHAYNGSPQGVSFTADTGFTVSYFYTNKPGSPSWSSATAPTNFGYYNAEITVSRSGTQMGQKTVSLTIAKATPVFNLSGVNLNPIYNGQAQSISGATANSGGAISYENNSFINAGDYMVKIKVAETSNYNEGDINVLVKVQKATYDISGISFSSKTYTYDGTAKYISVTGTLPEGLSMQYEPFDHMINAGSTQITARFSVADTDNYNDIRDPLYAYLNINKANVNMDGISFPSASFVYSGTEKSITISGTLPQGVTVSYTGNKRTLVGSQGAQAHFTPPDAINYNAITSMSATITVTKATYNMSGVSFNNASKVYNGAEQALTITGTLPYGVSVAYENNKLTNVGSIVATANFTGDADNYFPIPSKSATLTITKADNPLAISVDDVFYSSPIVIDVVSNPSGGSVSYLYKLSNAGDGSYSATVPTALGEYTVKAYSEATSNYFAAEATATFSIIRAYYNLGNIEFDDISYTYDGQEKEITITGALPQGVSVIYSNNKLTNAGSIQVSASFAGDEVNYYPIELVLTATLTIDKATYNMSGVSFTDKYFSFEEGVTREITIDGTLPQGVSVTYVGNTLSSMGSTNATANFSGDEDNYELIPSMYATLYINDKGTFDLSGLSWIYDAPFMFDGSYQTVGINGLTYDSGFGYYIVEGIDPAILKVTNIMGISMRNAGNYTAFLKYEYNESGYNPPNFPDLNWSILKATYDMSGVSFEDKVYTYDGQTKKIEISGTLPMGIAPVYTQNTLTDVGSILVTVDFELVEPDNYYAIPSMEATLTIEKAQNALNFTVEDINYGQTLFIENIVNPSGGGLSYRYKEKGAGDDTYTPIVPNQAGEYVVRVQSWETPNYYSATVTKEFKINKATYNMSAITFEDAGYEYDGQEKELVITGVLPDGVSVEYTLNKLTNVGVLQVTATFIGDSVNYHSIDDKEATLTITQAENPMEAIVEDSVFGDPLNITIEDNLGAEEILYFKLQEEDDSCYSTTAPTELGSYTVKIVSEESQNFFEKTIIANFRITRPNYDMSGISFSDKTVTYDGNSYTITIVGELPEGVSVTYGVGSEHTNAGSYTIYAFFTGDEENYNTIPTRSATLTIERAENELEIQANDIFYNQPMDISIISNLSGAEIRYFYKKQGQDDIYYSDIVPRALGVYDVKAESLQTTNYKVGIDYSQFEIKRAYYDLSGISFEDATYVYNGQEKVLTITGSLPIGVIVNYLPNNKRTNVGEVNIEAKFEGDPINYYPIPSMYAKLTIEVAINNLSASIADITFGQNLDIKVSNPNGGPLLFNFKPQGAGDDEYTTAKPVNAGLYVAKIISAATENYAEAFFLVDFEINKATIDMSGVSFEDKTFEYDGEIHYLEISGILPKMLNTNYSDNRVQIDVGEYLASVEFTFLSDEQNYYPVELRTAWLIIEKATNRVFATVEDIFLGGELDIVVDNPAQGALTYLYKASGESEYSPVQPTAPGTYILKVISAETDCYKLGESETTFKINKFTYDMSSVSFANTVYIYDGTPKTLQIVGTLPEGVSVSYSANTLTEAGLLQVTATFTGDSSTHNAIVDKVATLTIHKAIIDMSNISFVDKKVTYDGYRKSITIAGTLPQGVSVSYKNNTLTKVGFVNAVAEFSHTSPNHEPIDSMIATLTIEKGTYDMSGIIFEDAAYIYDGQVKIITITGKLPEGVSVTYSSNALTQPGKVSATARFLGDSVNYNPIPHMIATLTVEKYEPLVSVIRTSEIQKITVNEDSITAILASNIESFELNLAIKGDASYALYADADCTESLAGHSLNLQEGQNTIFVKVMLEDGSEQIIKINLSRAEPPLISQEWTLVLLAASIIAILVLLVLVIKGRKLKPKKIKQ